VASTVYLQSAHVRRREEKLMVLAHMSTRGPLAACHWQRTQDCVPVLSTAACLWHSDCETSGCHRICHNTGDDTRGCFSSSHTTAAPAVLHLDCIQIQIRSGRVYQVSRHLACGKYIRPSCSLSSCWTKQKCQLTPILPSNHSHSLQRPLIGSYIHSFTQSITKSKSTKNHQPTHPIPNQHTSKCTPSPSQQQP